MPKNKKEELNPEMEEVGSNEEVDRSNLKEIAENIESSTIAEGNGEDSNTFYRTVVNQLFDKTNISSKTE